MPRPRKTTTSTEAPATAATHPQEQQELQAPTGLEGEQAAVPDTTQEPADQAHAVKPPEPIAPEWPTEPLDEFLRRVERVHIDRDVVATAATHPQATETTWPGTYGGIRLSAGPVSVTYSDGTTE
ncbi:hypothetical protein [Comamonas sp. GB3 AK4-5]|uniref:hypothetical protein n=1 Tax=Comamonas sp. GB3 AK4-5 TaxID=3231487 RepID=UPI00351F124B